MKPSDSKNLVSFAEFRQDVMKEKTSSTAAELISRQYQWKLRLLAARDTYKSVLRYSYIFPTIAAAVLIFINLPFIKSLIGQLFNLIAETWIGALGLTAFVSFIVIVLAVIAWAFVTQAYFYKWSKAFEYDAVPSLDEISEHSQDAVTLNKLGKVINYFREKELNAYFDEHGSKSDKEIVDLKHWQRNRVYLMIFFDPGEWVSGTSCKYLKAGKLFFDLNRHQYLLSRDATSYKGSVTGEGIMGKNETQLHETFPGWRSVAKAIVEYVPENRRIGHEGRVIRGMLKMECLDDLRNFLKACLKEGVVKDGRIERLSLAAILAVASFRQTRKIGRTSEKPLGEKFKEAVRNLPLESLCEEDYPPYLHRFFEIYAEHESFLKSSYHDRIELGNRGLQVTRREDFYQGFAENFIYLLQE